MLPEKTISEILRSVQPYSMVHESGIRFAINAALTVIERNLHGVLVECGVWRGGCSLAMLLGQRAAFGQVRRPVYMLDSFSGLPKVDTRDGPLASAWQDGVDPEKFFDNCRADESSLRALLAENGFAEGEYVICPGWFSETVPPLAKALSDRKIALLRLDGDWYKSTRICLDHLCPLVDEQGIVIVDDYYAWDGCARAVHDYLSANDLPYRIKSLDYNFGAYFVKRAFRGSFEEF